eukprot:scaffold1963_cov29-Phaeocystis_antarctica.AAC.1
MHPGRPQPRVPRLPSPCTAGARWLLRGRHAAARRGHERQPAAAQCARRAALCRDAFGRWHRGRLERRARRGSRRRRRRRARRAGAQPDGVVSAGRGGGGRGPASGSDATSCTSFCCGVLCLCDGAMPGL